VEMQAREPGRAAEENTGHGGRSRPIRSNMAWGCAQQHVRAAPWLVQPTDGRQPTVHICGACTWAFVFSSQTPWHSSPCHSPLLLRLLAGEKSCSQPPITPDAPVSHTSQGGQQERARWYTCPYSYCTYLWILDKEPNGGLDVHCTAGAPTSTAEQGWRSPCPA